MVAAGLGKDVDTAPNVTIRPGGGGGGGARPVGGGGGGPRGPIGGGGGGQPGGGMGAVAAAAVARPAPTPTPAPQPAASAGPRAKAMYDYQGSPQSRVSMSRVPSIFAHPSLFVCFCVNDLIVEVPVPKN